MVNKKVLVVEQHYAAKRVGKWSCQWSDKTVQQPCLPPQAERKIDALPERRKPQCSYSCIQIEHHVVLTPEEILLNLKDAKVFSIGEAKCIYRNVVLGKESIKLTTFGRYRFRRVPFSLKIAQDVFQTKMDQTFEGCKGVVGIADEIVLFGKINEEHDRNMHAMLKRLQTFLGDSKLLGPCYSKPKNTDSSRLRGVPHLPVRPKLYRLHWPQAPWKNLPETAPTT